MEAISEAISIRGAREGNLQNIDLDIPRGKLVVLTGLSGSGKSTLAVDVLYQECQRQYLEAMGYQGIRKPDVDSVRGASPAIVITQDAYHKNPRSSVGTATDIYTELRMLYEKLCTRNCPFCGEAIRASDCREETEGHGEDFRVYMYCCRCGRRMDKLTRTHFSFNTREGACPACQGLGYVLRVDETRVLHEDLSLEDGAVDYWQQKYKEYQIGVFFAALRHYGLPVPTGLPLASFSPLQRMILLHGTQDEALLSHFPHVAPPRTVSEGKYEGVCPILWRRLSDQGAGGGAGAYFAQSPCPDCHGERLGALPRSATVAGMRLPELAVLPLEELGAWLCALETVLTRDERALVAPYLEDLRTKIGRIVRVGLGYLTPDRQTMTLSGGEAQRIKLSATLSGTLTGLLYVLDEPTIGLHPRDTGGILQVMRDLSDQGNTVLVIEHDPDVIRAADYVVDIGPGSGRFGGRVVGQGTPQALAAQAGSPTGQWLRAPRLTCRDAPPGMDASICIEDARLHNLKRLSVRFPKQCLTSVTGVSGSGKSSLVFGVLAQPGTTDARVSGLDAFERVVTVAQSQIARMRRSNVATFIGLYDAIRKRFAQLPEAKALGLTASHFSFNTKGGRCEHCEGLGTVTSNMLFFEDIEAVCPVCHGQRFTEDVLSVCLDGRSITDVLALDVDEAAEALRGISALQKSLALLREVGLGYLTLGQTLTTLSGGEAQRLKLARELLGGVGKKSLYLIDEPTTGLHPLDVEHFLTLLRRMVDAGNTVILVEHNLQAIAASDWVVDLGPDGGNRGGELVACGTPKDICACPSSATGKALQSFFGGMPNV